MSVDKVKAELISDFNSYIDTINRLPLHPKNKLNIIYEIYVQQSQMAFFHIQFRRNLG